LEGLGVLVDVCTLKAFFGLAESVQVAWDEVGLQTTTL